MKRPSLQLKNISRSFLQGNDHLHILKNIDLELKVGECTALLGPSGSGKTTLLQIAGLLDSPTSGNIFIHGHSVQSSDKARTLLRRKHIGFVYQFHHLLYEFSALENVILPQYIAGVSKKKSEEHATHLLKKLGLEYRLHHRPSALSGGEQQRVAIARALSNTPTILLADEPTGNLDDATGELVFQEMIQLVSEQNLTALIATHNINLAKRTHKVIHLKGGLLGYGIP